jgi:hypothetical protein
VQQRFSASTEPTRKRVTVGQDKFLGWCLSIYQTARNLAGVGNPSAPCETFREIEQTKAICDS